MTSVATPEPADETAIRGLYSRHGAPLLAWARRRFADTREAEEVVQDTIVLAWRRADQFDSQRGTERAWLFGILRNTAASRHRASGRRLQLLRPDDVAGVAVPAPWAGEAEAALDRAELIDAMQSLPADHRAVIVAAHFHGERVAAIAEALAIPEGTVKSRLYYGLRKLRAELEERGVLG